MTSYIPQPAISPSLEEVTRLLLGDGASSPSQGNTIPVYVTVPADLITPVMAYLRLTNGADKSNRGFLCESITGGEKIGRYSFVGASEYRRQRPSIFIGTH